MYVHGRESPKIKVQESMKCLLRIPLKFEYKRCSVVGRSSNVFYSFPALFPYCSDVPKAKKGFFMLLACCLFLIM